MGGAHPIQTISAAHNNDNLNLTYTFGVILISYHHNTDDGYQRVNEKNWPLINFKNI